MFVCVCVCVGGYLPLDRCIGDTYEVKIPVYMPSPPNGSVPNATLVK